jgi:hypothetical protein
MWAVDVAEMRGDVETHEMFGPFRAEASAADFARQVDREPRRQARVIELRQPVIEVRRSA